MSNIRRMSHVTAILVAMHGTFEKPRMRISEKTLRVVGKRQRIRAAFVASLRENLEEEGITLVELEQGYCLISLSSLAGVKPYTISRFREDTGIDVRDEDALWAYVSDLSEPERAEVGLEE